MRRRLGTWLFWGLTATGCATTGTLQNGVYHGEQTSYQIGTVSSDWTPVTVNQQNDLAWHNRTKGAVMHVDSDCDPALDIPLTALRSHLMIGFTEREIGDVWSHKYAVVSDGETTCFNMNDARPVDMDVLHDAFGLSREG